MEGGLWRSILGWLLVVAGILVVLLGAAAVGGSYLPDAQDPVGTRIVAAIVIAVGLLLGAGGIRLIRSGRRIARAAPKTPRLARRFTRVHAVGYAAAVVLGAAFGVGAIIYSFSLDGEVQSFRSSHRCPTAPDANCYQLRDVVITGVDISHGRGGETDTVHFTDSGSSREVAIHPGALDSSVLRTGAEGVATVWHGKYTNLDVSAETTGYLILPLVLHPTLPKSRSIVWFVALPVALVFEFFYFAQYGRVVQWTIGAASALLLAWGAIWQLVLVPRSAIYVDDLSFGKVSGFGRRKSWDRSEAAGVVLRSLDRGRRVPALPSAFVVGPDGRARMRFSAALYDEDSYTKFAEALRVPLNTDAVAVPIVPAQLEKEIPGSTSWAARHATAVGAGMATVGGAVILLLVELSSGPSQR